MTVSQAIPLKITCCQHIKVLKIDRCYIHIVKTVVIALRLSNSVINMHCCCMPLTIKLYFLSHL